MTKVDWEAIGENLPEASSELLKLVADAHESGGDEPARAVELMLREQIAGLKRRFEALKGGDE